MNLFAILTHAGLSIVDLKNLLEHVAESSLDVAPVARDLLVKLEGAVTPEGTIALAKAIVPEALDIAHLKINPRFHPGDAA